jgi:hypothetical protein
MLNQMQNQINTLNIKLNSGDDRSSAKGGSDIVWPLVCPYCHFKIKKSDWEKYKMKKDPGAITLPLAWESFLEDSTASQAIISEKKIFGLIFHIYEEVVDNYNKTGG